MDPIFLLGALIAIAYFVFHILPNLPFVSKTNIAKINILKGTIGQANAEIVDLVQSELADIRKLTDKLAGKHDALLDVDHDSVPTEDLTKARDTLASLAVPGASS